MTDPTDTSLAADLAPRAEQSSVWSDAWRYLRTNPMFLIGCTIMVVMVSMALIAFGWMTAMRLVRSSVVAIRGSDYVLAAQALGAPTLRILVRHILPNALAPVLVYATIAVGTFISAEAALTYLGIGLQAPEISWGLQINVAQSLIGTSPHLLFFPALFLSITVLGFILLGDTLRDALDPKRR